MIYLDFAATTPMSSTAISAYQQAAEQFFGNSNSLHDEGSNASGALESSRKLISSILDVPPNGLHFTGSGSEASFLAIYSLAMASRQHGNHIITSQAEHSSVHNACNWLERQGFAVTKIPLSTGSVDMEALSDAIRPDTILVSIQHVNSETGAINPIKKISDLLEDHPAAFHSDCVQSFCKLDLKPSEWNIDSISISAHKVHGPKGLGAAYINPKRQWKAFIPETNQEHGFRPGTVDVPAIVAFAAAAREQHNRKSSNFKHLESLKNRFIDRVRQKCGDSVIFEGDLENCSPWITGVRLEGMEGQFAMLQCSQKGVGISTGSACQVNEQKPSATMLAMGYGEEEARQFIRFSFDAATTNEEVDKAADVLSNVLHTHLSHVKM